MYLVLSRERKSLIFSKPSTVLGLVSVSIYSKSLYLKLARPINRPPQPAQGFKILSPSFVYFL